MQYRVTIDRDRPNDPVPIQAIWGGCVKWQSLDQQLETIRRYNERYWENYLSEEQLRSVQVDCRRRFNGLELALFHVQFWNDAQTMQRWWHVFQGELDLAYDNGLLHMPPFPLLKVGRAYTPGIHLVGLQIRRGWPENLNRNVAEARKWAIDARQRLAGVELLSAYGLHPHKLREHDGKKLPLLSMASFDTEMDASGLAPFLGWLRRPDMAILGLSSVRRCDGDFTFPCVVDPRDYGL